jgi:hypothetical protein
VIIILAQAFDMLAFHTTAIKICSTLCSFKNYIILIFSRNDEEKMMRMERAMAVSSQSQPLDCMACGLLCCCLADSTGNLQRNLQPVSVCIVGGRQKQTTIGLLALHELQP